MATSTPEMVLSDGLKSFTWKNLHPIKRTEDMEQKCKPEIVETCLCEVSETGDCIPRPAAPGTVDTWDNDHVKLPCSPQNLQKGRPVKQWSIIQQALSGSLESAEDFKRAVLRYNGDYARGSWNDDMLAAALELRPEFGPLLKKIADLALKLPYLIMQPIPLMKGNQESSISLSQIQIACLLANAFYCTFPGRSGTNTRTQQPPFPSVNFNTLFYNPSPQRAAAAAAGAAATQLIGDRHRFKVQKVICILHYFSRVLAEDGAPTGAVTFSRRCLRHPPDFESSAVLIGSVPLGTSSTGRIEDAGSDCLQVDFADPYIGGEFLRFGNVQEELMCCMQPEILAGRLFMERLLPREAALVIGAERFCSCRGYARDLEWAEDFREADHGSARDARGRWKKWIVAIDATHFKDASAQFQDTYLYRELNKAFIGFTDMAAPYEPLPSTVVSGNWGCGVFKGNKALKALLQLMACAQAGKALAYSTFQDEFLEKELQRTYDKLVASECTVGRLWSILTRLRPTRKMMRSYVTTYVFEMVNQ